MKLVHLRYATLTALREDVQLAFPNWDGDKTDPPKWMHKHAYIKIERDNTGTILKRDVYLLVKDDFVLPAWVQGVVIVGQANHGFLGYT